MEADPSAPQSCFQIGGLRREREPFQLRRRSTSITRLKQPLFAGINRKQLLCLLLGQMDVERVQAEVEAKVAAEQQNEDILLRKIRAQVTHATQRYFVVLSSTAVWRRANFSLEFGRVLGIT